MVRTLGCITLMLVGCRPSSAALDTQDAGAASARTLTQRTGSCDRSHVTGTCSEYSGSYLESNQLLLTTSCGKLGGTFVYAECPNTSVVGECTLSTGEIRKFYGTGTAAYEPGRANAECETSFRGKWLAR